MSENVSEPCILPVPNHSQYAGTYQHLFIGHCDTLRLEVSIAKKGKGSPYSITERRVPELIPVLSSQPAGDVSHIHKPGGRLPLLSAHSNT